MDFCSNSNYPPSPPQRLAAELGVNGFPDTPGYQPVRATAGWRWSWVMVKVNGCSTRSSIGAAHWQYPEVGLAQTGQVQDAIEAAHENA
jgi:hypothetical protein